MALCTSLPPGRTITSTVNSRDCRSTHPAPPSSLPETSQTTSSAIPRWPVPATGTNERESTRLLRPTRMPATVSSGPGKAIICCRADFTQHASTHKVSRRPDRSASPGTATPQRLVTLGLARNLALFPRANPLRTVPTQTKLRRSKYQAAPLVPQLTALAHNLTLTLKRHYLQYTPTSLRLPARHLCAVTAAHPGPTAVSSRLQSTSRPPVLAPST